MKSLSPFLTVRHRSRCHLAFAGLPASSPAPVPGATDPHAGDRLSVIAAGPATTNGPANKVILDTGPPERYDRVVSP